ncbi:MAG: hypothetical protein WBF84_12550 [Castellaniella sp.]|uniref:hypothetical protein n=1 Tax=Castellaniella sp. TaxID=1955812 RepID=UPI003C721DE1
MSGKREFTNGYVNLWVGKGETKVVAQSSASFTYGVKTDFSIGASSSLAIGIKTALALNAGVDVAVGESFTIKKQNSFSIAKKFNEFYADSAVTGVGAADATDVATLKRLEFLTWILVGAQSAVAVSFAVLALGRLIDQTVNGKLNDKGEVEIPKDAEVSDALHGFRTFPMGYLSSALTIIANLAAMFLLIYARYKKSQTNAAPNAVLSLDKQSAAFLGIAPLGKTASSGATLDENGIDLSTSTQNLGFNTVNNNSSVIGFNQKPGKANVPGARLKLYADGDIKSWGKNFVHTSSDDARYIAKKHTLEIKDKDPVAEIDKDGVRLKAKAGTTMSLDAGAGKITAIGGGGSAMSLEAKASSFGTGGSQLICKTAGVELKFGSISIKLSSSGVKIGGALTILEPGAPQLTSAELTSIKAKATSWDAQLEKDALALETLTTKQQLQEQALTTLKESLIAVRTTVDEVAAKTSESGTK